MEKLSHHFSHLRIPNDRVRSHSGELANQGCVGNDENTLVEQPHLHSMIYKDEQPSVARILVVDLLLSPFRLATQKTSPRTTQDHACRYRFSSALLPDRLHGTNLIDGAVLVSPVLHDRVEPVD